MFRNFPDSRLSLPLRRVSVISAIRHGLWACQVRQDPVRSASSIGGVVSDRLGAPTPLPNRRPGRTSAAGCARQRSLYPDRTLARYPGSSRPAAHTNQSRP